MSQPVLETFLGRADAAIELNRAEEGERAARQALAIDPSSERANAQLTRALLMQSRTKDALRVAEAGIAACPGSEWLHRLRSSCLRRLGKLQDALAAIDEAVRIAPGSASAHHARSGVLQQLGRIDEARKAAERAISLDPDDGACRMQLGHLWLDDDPRAAEELYRESLRLDPTSALALTSLGMALSREHRTEEAAEAFRSAVRLDPVLDIAKRNAHRAARRIINGSATIVLLFFVALAAKVYFGAEARIQPWVLGFALLAIGVGFAVWRAFEGIRVRRLAQEAPQLHALYVALEAERKAGRLRG